MAEHDNDVLPPSDTTSVSLDGRRLTDADLYAVAARPDITRVKIYGLKQSLAPLATLASLRQLELTDPHTLDGLELMQQLGAFPLDMARRLRYLVRVKKLLGGLGLVLLAMLGAPSHLSGQSAGGGLVLFGDIVYFYPPGTPKNCLLNNQFKRGEPVGFRMNAINPATGKRDRATELVVHLTFAGKAIDLPMRDRQNERQPEREFWVAKWMVPDDAPTGIVRYTVTAKDPQGRTGEYKPFEVQASQLTIVP